MLIKVRIKFISSTTKCSRKKYEKTTKSQLHCLDFLQFQIHGNCNNLEIVTLDTILAILVFLPGFEHTSSG